MAQITLKQLDAFVQVADLGSFRRAADKLGTTQPNISARIAGLEAQLGTQLMLRDAGSVRLTPSGTTLLVKAREVLRSVEGFIVAAGDSNLFEGVMRLGVTEMIVHAWLQPFLAAFRTAFPSVTVELTVDLSANLSTALAGRKIDLALQNGPFDDVTSGNVDLGRFEMAWVAAPGLGLPDGPVQLRNLTAHPILTHDRSTLPYEQLLDHVVSGADTPARFVPSTNLAACLQLAADGLGVACLPEVMVRNQVTTGALRRIEYAWVPDSLWFRARFDADTAPEYLSKAANMAGEIAANGS